MSTQEIMRLAKEYADAAASYHLANDPRDTGQEFCMDTAQAALEAAIESLTAERDALKADNEGWSKSCETLLAQRNALDKAARLALYALTDVRYVPRYAQDQAIAALKAVL